MIVTRLKLANFRVIETAELRFQRGMNLVVGVTSTRTGTMARRERRTSTVLPGRRLGA